MTTDIIKVSVFVNRYYASPHLRKANPPRYVVVNPNSAQTYLDDPEWLLVDGFATLQVQRPTLEELGAV